MGGEELVSRSAVEPGDTEQGIMADRPEHPDYWDEPDQLPPAVPYCAERSMELEDEIEQIRSRLMRALLRSS